MAEEMKPTPKTEPANQRVQIASRCQTLLTIASVLYAIEGAIFLIVMFVVGMAVRMGSSLSSTLVIPISCVLCYVIMLYCTTDWMRDLHGASGISQDLLKTRQSESEGKSVIFK